MTLVNTLTDRATCVSYFNYNLIPFYAPWYLFYSPLVPVLLTSNTHSTHLQYLFYSPLILVLLTSDTCSTHLRYLFYSPLILVLLTSDTWSTHLQYLFYSPRIPVLLTSDTWSIHLRYLFTYHWYLFYSPLLRVPSIRGLHMCSKQELIRLLGLLVTGHYHNDCVGVLIAITAD